MKPAFFIALLMIYAVILWSAGSAHAKSPTQVPVGEPTPWELVCTLNVDRHNRATLNCYIPATYLPSWDTHGKRTIFTPRESVDTNQ